MAQKKQLARTNARKHELSLQLAEARHSIGRGKQDFKGHLSIKKQLRRFSLSNPKALFSSSVAAGLILTLFLKRPKKPKRASHKTSKQILLTWGLSLLKPAAKTWLMMLAKKNASGRISRLQRNDRYKNLPANPEDPLMDA